VRLCAGFPVFDNNEYLLLLNSPASTVALGGVLMERLCQLFLEWFVPDMNFRQISKLSQLVRQGITCSSFIGHRGFVKLVLRSSFVSSLILLPFYFSFSLILRSTFYFQLRP
jgi:hypothetical protein